MPIETVAVAASSNVTISTALVPGQVLNGRTLVLGDLVLLPAQSDATKNGLYRSSAFPERDRNYSDVERGPDGAYDKHSGVIVVDQHNGTVYLGTSAPGGTLGTDDIDFEVMGVGAILAAIVAAITSVDQIKIPPGATIPYSGLTAPSGWLLCYGQNVSRTTYADLFAAIDTQHGAGDGSTTFGIPDLRGRVPAGQDDMGGSSANRLTGLTGGIDGDIFGSTGGAESHVLTEAQLASHDHSVNPPSTGSGTESGTHTHAVSGTTGTVSANHTHDYRNGSDTLRQSGGSTFVQNNNNYGATVATSGFSANHTHSFYDTSTTQSANHTHTTDITAFNSATAGSGSAHNNVQPTIILNYIIKY